jgi:hypothetical protein
MRHSHIAPAIAAGAIVAFGARGADVITYDSADRWIAAQCPAGSDQEDAIGFDPFDAVCQIGDPVWGFGGVFARQTSTLEPKWFAAEGEAAARADNFSYHYGDSYSVFDVTITIDETSAFSLEGVMHGRGSYSLTGPGLDLQGSSHYFDMGADFCESHVTGPGSFRFQIILESHAYYGSPPEADYVEGGFELDLQLEPARAADVSGQDGPGHWDGRVDALDLLHVIANWGDTCAAPCYADITGPATEPDGVVDAFDFLAVVLDWG